MGKRLLYLIFILLSHCVTAQDIEDLSFSFENGVIVVRYDIEDTNPNQRYEFYLYSSHDNYKLPLQKVTGDVGPQVVAGVNKTMYWDARNELGNFKGNLNLKIKGGFYIPIVSFQSPQSNQKTKKGKPIDIQWTSKCDDVDELKIQLLDNDQLVDECVAPNSGSCLWKIEKKIKTGSDYRIRITEKDNDLRCISSEPFKIKPKVNTWVKVVPVAAILGAVSVIYGTQKNDQAVEEPPGLPTR